MVEHTRTLDFKVAFAIGLGTMIAAGIFSLSGTAVAEIGASAVIAFVIAAAIAGITAAAYSEFASIYSENGGGYLFTSRTFEDRDLVTYGIGASLFLGYTGTTAFYLATMDEWFTRFILPEWLAWLPAGSSGVAAALFLGALNARGTEESGTFQLLVSGAKVAVLIAFVAGALAYHGPAEAGANFAAQFSSDVLGILTIAALAFITFFGFSAIAASAGEIIEPRRTVPRAIAASIITVTVLYTLVIVAMTNSTVPPEVIAAEGETAMGEVAHGFLGPIGRSLIVAGAVFSMVSASNASILAASSIGSLMGRQGQAPRAFSLIHRRFGTPFWSVLTATGTVVALIVTFMAIFPEEGGALGVNLGLTPLTGFATFNLLFPLAVVNVALVVHRRRYPDIERGFRVPGVPAVPVIGILANVGLIYNLPRSGVALGVVLTSALLAVYVAWGGAPDVDELVHRVSEARPTGVIDRGRPDDVGAATPRQEVGGEEAGEYRVLVPVAQPENASTYVRLAELLALGRPGRAIVQVVTVTQIPDQTPHEVVADEAAGRGERIAALLDAEEHPIEYTVEAHTCRDIAFDILQTARDDGADLILMGYPEEHERITQSVEMHAPCDVVFASGFDGESIDAVNVGSGGGPHHLGAIPLVRALANQGADVHVITVDPERLGTREDPGNTVAMLGEIADLFVHNVTAPTVADGLVRKAAETGGILVIGASRDRRLRQWVFGSTPDRVVELAERRDVPILIYASAMDISTRLEDYVFPIYRYLRKYV